MMNRNCVKDGLGQINPDHFAHLTNPSTDALTYMNQAFILSDIPKILLFQNDN